MPLFGRFRLTTHVKDTEREDNPAQYLPDNSTVDNLN